MADSEDYKGAEEFLLMGDIVDVEYGESTKCYSCL
jgi:hypothetical protein